VSSLGECSQLLKPHHSRRPLPKLESWSTEPVDRRCALSVAINLSPGGATDADVRVASPPLVVRRPRRAPGTALSIGRPLWRHVMATD